ncbi:15160_t:CDS:2 [Rhizophagus irregularis]|nr:15160_t:CDS:2 [Rhizophagus irregularis]
MNQSERTPSNVPSYVSLTIRRRRNNRRGKHVEILIHIENITLSHYALNKLNYTATQAVDYCGQAHKWTDTYVVSSYKENKPCSDARINDRTKLWEN